MFALRSPPPHWGRLPSPTAFPTQGTRNLRAWSVIRPAMAMAVSRSSDREAAPTAIIRRRHGHGVSRVTARKSIRRRDPWWLPLRSPDTHRDPGRWSFATPCMSRTRAWSVTRHRSHWHPLRRRQGAGTVTKITMRPDAPARRVIRSRSRRKLTGPSKWRISAAMHVTLRRRSHGLRRHAAYAVPATSKRRRIITIRRSARSVTSFRIRSPIVPGCSRDRENEDR